jgi:type II secretory pathway pseudopilin PulG
MAQRSNNNRIKGFTLLETIVAVTVLTFAIMGPLELAARSIGLAVVSKNQITAFYLAQEAMEYVKNKRDSNFLAPSSNWLTGLDGCFGVNGCYVDVPNDGISVCAGSCPVLKYDNNGLYYNYFSGNDTVFTRTVKINTPVSGNPNEAKVQIIISWIEKLNSKTLTLEDNIFNWK